MERTNRGRSQAITLIIGVALSTLLGVFFYFKTDMTTALATFAGLIGTTITLQVESLLQEREAREQATRQQRLVQRIEATSWLPELLDEAVGSYAVIEHTYGSTMARELARKAFDDCRTRLAELQRGWYTTSDPDESPNSPTLALTARLHDSLLATSPSDDVAWWLDPPVSQNYWRLNLEAMKRGVVIKRIFVYRDWFDELDNLAKAQHNAGVQVFRIAEPLLPSTLRLNITIWDGQCACQPRYNATGEWITTNFTFAKQELSQLLDRFSLIESFAEPWPPAPGA